MSYYDRDKSPAPTKMQWPKPHFGSVSEYQVSPWPFCKTVAIGDSSTINEVSFEGVTRWICITAQSNDVKITFADPTTDGWVSYFIVPAGATSPRIEVKCTKIWVSADVPTSTTEITVTAGVTSVGTSQFPDISGRTGVSHT